MAGTATQGPVISVTIDDLSAHWCDGVFAGDDVLIAEATFSAEIGATLRLGCADVTADADTPLGAAAALASYKPGRALFTSLPADVADQLFGELCGPSLFDA